MVTSIPLLQLLFNKHSWHLWIFCELIWEWWKLRRKEKLLCTMVDLWHIAFLSFGDLNRFYSIWVYNVQFIRCSVVSGNSADVQYKFSHITGDCIIFLSLSLKRSCILCLNLISPSFIDYKYKIVIFFKIKMVTLDWILSDSVSLFISIYPF